MHGTTKTRKGWSRQQTSDDFVSNGLDGGSSSGGTLPPSPPGRSGRGTTHTHTFSSSQRRAAHGQLRLPIDLYDLLACISLPRSTPGVDAEVGSVFSRAIPIGTRHVHQLHLSVCFLARRTLVARVRHRIPCEGSRLKRLAVNPKHTNRLEVFMCSFSITSRRCLRPRAHPKPVHGLLACICLSTIQTYVYEVVTEVQSDIAIRYEKGEKRSPRRAKCNPIQEI